jgi:ubiquinone/menaquinone biosynthesis C-methylase UbiE
MLALPFSSGSFDGAWACSTLVHLPHAGTKRAVAEIARVLRPGGALYIGLEEGRGCEWRVEENGARRLYYFWSREDLALVLNEAGLDVQEQFVEHVGPWHFLTVLGVRSSP